MTDQGTKQAKAYRIEKYVDGAWQVFAEADGPDEAIETARRDANKYLEFSPHIFNEGDGMLSVDQPADEAVYRIIRLA